ncbi:hypothetical protein F4803DRAFT_564391 [Xylaria telfairii]|nr:hypothetical protein F4803DRAFT_564391 [Xylaria telfairii]
MDAQNAAESSNTKQLASPKGGDTGPDAPKPKPLSALATNTLKSPTNTKVPSTLDDDAALDQNSDAETIVLPGKDGISPSKPRKVIKHEDKSDDEINSIPRPRKPLKATRDADYNGGHSDDATSIAFGGKKKRQSEKESQRANNNSGALGSAPTSPPIHNRTSHVPSHRRRRSGDVHSESGSESSKSRSHKLSHKDKAKSVERLLSGKRRAVKTESDDDGEVRKVRRSRISDASIDALAGARDRDHRTLVAKHADKQSTMRNRSASPPSRIHRRSISTQLPSQSSNGLSNKKRRVPAPLQSTEYQSDDSSASGSPHPRSSKLKSVATPLTGESTISPARMPAHKKHVDNHGQTLFAKACAKGEYEIARKRLAERPEDLNFADYAGNTPLQVASLNGHEDIVQLLIEAGCNLDCRNSDKETPLLDAVENGHLAVVKLLLKAGVNPRKADAEGHEPLEKVPDDLDNAEEIRAALREAKERVGELHRASEDQQPQDIHDTLSSHGPDSPRDSPAAPIGSLLAEKRRGGTTLRQAAARVKERCDDPEALVNAARGGGANPDPRPENVEFNPTRLFKGHTYYEIAQEHLLKEAYDHYNRGSKGSSKAKPSPGRRERERERERELDVDSRRGTRNDPSSDLSRPQKRRTSKPNPINTQDEHTSKRGPGRPKRDERGSNTASSDREISPARTKNPAMPKLIEPELISGKDLKGQREKQRRESLASNISSRGDREKHLSRTKALRREESTDRLSSTDVPGKRHRSSTSPSRRGRRKLDPDAKDRRYLEPPSPERRHTKRELSRDPTQRQRNPENDREEISKSIKTSRDNRESEKASNPDKKMQDTIQVRRAPSDAEQEEMRQMELEAEKKRLEAEERARIEREELKQEQRLREEEERKRREEEERKQREEEERRQKEEQERREQAEEEARRIREEQERQEKERERAEQAAREVELQRARQAEQERIRVSKLPPLLRWLDGCSNPRQRELAELFAKAQGVRYDTIDPSATGKPGGRDQWLLNTQVALLLGEKDLSLAQYVSWERVPVSSIAKRVIWRLEQDRYALTESKLYHLGEELSDLYGGDPRTVGYRKLEQIRGEAANRFLETEMFFVKESDFLHIIPSVPHLSNVRIAICYRELPENESDLFTFTGPSKWKHDPDAASRGSFAPRNKYYVNGELVGEEKPGKYRLSREPFPEHRVPRRHGLVAVTPDEPDYARLCIEQNLAYLLTEQQKQSVMNGSHLTPKSMTSNEPTEYAGENLSPSSVSPHTHITQWNHGRQRPLIEASTGSNESYCSIPHAPERGALYTSITALLLYDILNSASIMTARSARNEFSAVEMGFFYRRISPTYTTDLASRMEFLAFDWLITAFILGLGSTLVLSNVSVYVNVMSRRV